MLAPHASYNGTNLDAVASAELVDTVSSANITSLCGGQQTSVVGGDGKTYTVVKFFSNAANRCVP